MEPAMKRILIITILIFTSFSFIKAQDFGDISDQELKMTKYDKDPDANAVYLFNKQDLVVNHHFNLDIYRHWRMKILTDAGKEYANVKISYWGGEDIAGLKAKSYSPNGDEFKLDSDNIVKQENKDVDVVSFAIPGVVAGSVIEVEYKIHSEYISSLRPWYFQGNNYTALSELTLIMPTGLAYTDLKLNLTPYDITETSEKIRDPEDPRKTLTQFKWTGRDIPGLKDEPFVDNIYDKYAKIIFFIQGYYDEYQNIDLSKSWDDIAKKFLNFYRPYLQKDFKDDGKISKIITGNNEPIEKAKNIYNYIRNEIKTSNDRSIFDDDFRDADKLLTEKSGTASEKNIFLIDLLTKAGFDAKPIFISTRANGEFISDFHDPGQFNRILCLLNISSRSYFLDTGIKSDPFGFLTPSISVDKGLLLDNNKGTIIKIIPTLSFNRTFIATDAEIKGNGLITAKTQITYEGSPAVMKRNELLDQDLKKYMKDYVEKLSKDAVLDTFYIVDLDSIEKPLIINIKYSLPNYTNQVENMVYFKAPLFTAISKNPFIKDKRYFSIDYGNKETTEEKLKINLPSNMTINELPVGKAGSIREFSFSRTNVNASNQILCDRSISIYDKSVPYTNYNKLKEIYDGMVNSDQEQIVLSKNSATAK
jgi:hypothetical protein